jgi:hypothetical protein
MSISNGTDDVNNIYCGSDDRLLSSQILYPTQEPQMKNDKGAEEMIPHPNRVPEND